MNFKNIVICFLPIVLISCTSQPESPPAIEPPLSISTFIYNETTNTYVCTLLEKNMVYELDASGGGGMTNINLLLSCEGGSAKIISEDHEIQLSMGNSAIIFRGDRKNRTYGYEFEIMNEGYISAIPYGSALGVFDFSTTDLSVDMEKRKNGYLGKEYILDIYGYELGHQVVHAELTFTQLEDPDFPDSNKSGRFSIEMTAYEYSDRYKMMLE